MTELATTNLTAIDLPPSQVEQVVEFLSKSYTDADCLHIMPELTSELLLQVKEQNAETILRGMRDYYLVSRFNDDAMDRIEAMALEKLELTLALEVDPRVVLNVFTKINAAKRRSLGEGQNTPSTIINNETKIVQIMMPARMLNHSQQDFETNSNNEVIRVGKTLMVTATNVQVLEQLKSRQKLALEDAYDGV